MSDLRCVEVASASAPYQVQIGPGARAGLPELVGDAARVAVVHPAAMAPQLPVLIRGLTSAITPIEVPDGEAAKTAVTLTRCWDTLAAAGFTRSDVVVGFGGGAATDLAGFVAASWLRGVALITIPTTVLGMVDAAIGGKTGINLTAGKNLVGAFHEQRGVLCDLDWLATLPAAETRAGLAEVIKCGFIADPGILTLAESAQHRIPTGDVLAELIVRAISVKAAVVAADLRETTSTESEVGRELLNYGHTLGHAIERHSNYRIRHGEAIAVGMVFAAELSRLTGGMAPALVSRHRSLLGGLGLPTSYPRAAWSELRDAMALDKKTRGATLRFVLLDEVGVPRVLSGPSEPVLTEAYAAVGA